MYPINQITSVIWQIMVIAGAISFVGFIISAMYIIFFTPTKSKDDEDRKIIMIILTFILIAIAGACSATQHTM